MEELIAAVSQAIEDETERTIGEPSGMGDQLARAALRAVAEHFLDAAGRAPSKKARAARLAVVDLVHPD